MRTDVPAAQPVVTTTTLKQILSDLSSLGVGSEERMEMAFDLVRSGQVRLTGRAAQSVYRQLCLPGPVHRARVH